MAGFEWSPGFLSGVAKREGFTATPKWDNKQYSWGHGTRWVPGMPTTITPEQARADMVRELNEAATPLATRWPSLSQNQREALASLTMNVGPGWIGDSNLSRAVDAGDWQNAGRILQQYNLDNGAVSNGLVRRRKWEAEMLGTTPLAESIMPTDTVVRFGGAANTKGRPPANAVPVSADLMGQTSRLDIGAQRSKILADMLNKMAYSSEAPKSNLEGASRVLAAVAGGWKAKQQDKAELEKRSALAELLGGGAATPLQQYAMASGDPTMMNTMLAGEIAKDAKGPDAKTLRLNDLLQQGVDPKIAHGIVNGSIVFAQDGTMTDLTSGLRYGADGATVQLFTPNGAGAPLPAQNPQAAQGAQAGATVPASQGVQPAGPTPTDGLPAIAQDVINPRAGEIPLNKEQKSKLEEDSGSLAKTEATLQAIVDTIDPRMFTQQGRWANWLQDTANSFSIDPGVSDPYQAQTQRMAIKQLFNEYRKYVTGAAAAQQELQQLEEAFINSNMTAEQAYAAIETLLATGRRNYQINQKLVQRGLSPGAGDYGQQFDQMAAQMGVDLAGVPGRAKSRLEAARKTWAEKDKAAASAKKSEGEVITTPDGLKWRPDGNGGMVRVQ